MGDNITSGYFNNDIFGQELPIILSVGVTVMLLLTSIVIISLNKTRRTPKAVRILSSYLLLFDNISNVAFMFRRHVTQEIAHYVQIVGTTSLHLAFLAVMLMALDRLLVFQWPIFYIKHVTYRRTHICALTVFVTITTLFHGGRFALCYAAVPEATLSDMIVKCKSQTSIFLYVFNVLQMTVAISSHARVFCILRHQMNRNFFTKNLQDNKSTALVFFFMANVMLNGLCYAIFISFVFNPQDLVIFNDILTLLNAIIDVSLYALWFRECRWQILKLLSFYFSCLEGKSEKMRQEIFLLNGSASL